MIKRSEGKQEEMTTLNTIPIRGDVAHHTLTNGNTWVNIHNDELSGADETYARTHPKH